MKNYFQDIGLWPNSQRIKYAYIAGFVISLALTLIAYSISVQGGFSVQEIAVSVALMALLQFAVQVYCFLHLGKEAGARERLIVLCAAILIVGILVSGSLWIMFSLNGRMMPDTTQQEEYMNAQLGF